MSKDSKDQEWSVGFMTTEGKYFTCETFGFALNSAALTMKKKQEWTMIAGGENNVWRIRSHVGRYLSHDKRGKVTADVENPGEEELFCFEYVQDNSGRFTMKSKKYNMYLRRDGEKQFSGNHRDPESYWFIRLFVHPQVNIFTISRRKYAKLIDTYDEQYKNGPPRIATTEVIPWGAECVFTVVFVDGKYAIKAGPSVLKSDGSLGNDIGEDSLFTLEVMQGQHHGLVFKDRKGWSLSFSGPEGQLKTRDKTHAADKLFKLEDSDGQVAILAYNDKYVSCSHGETLLANKNREKTEDGKDARMSQNELFQLEWNSASKQWMFRSVRDKYWSYSETDGLLTMITVGENKRSGHGLFDLEYQEGDRVAIKSKTGKYVTCKGNGSLGCSSSAVGENEKFRMILENRYTIVLGCQHGFMNFKTADSTRVQCNKATYDTFIVTKAPTEGYYIKGSNNKYWTLDDHDTLESANTETITFLLEFCDNSRVHIKASSNGKYLLGEQNGLVTATADKKKATMWEF